ncbi:MAG: hypothetical protein A2Y12_12895 [Planctomycetes bacterium GWF2_42_9]|nr:MAG: hypothetical protein A2Y12_12895 [Planctomycetes bacterium GWF2_42_9]
MFIAYSKSPVSICLRFEQQITFLAPFLAFRNEGIKMMSRVALIERTINNSINVNAIRFIKILYTIMLTNQHPYKKAVKEIYRF